MDSSVRDTRGDERGRYKVLGIECKNCDWSTGGDWFEIPRGTLIGEVDCPTCGCQTLRPHFGRRPSAILIEEEAEDG